MRISFVGKGGSGKSTMCALFAQYARDQGDEVLAIDADLNIHLPRLLGSEGLDEDKYLAVPSVTSAIKNRLIGSNDSIQNHAAFRKSTPPGPGSNLILSDNQRDPILDGFSTFVGKIRLMVVGTYHEEGIGASCYHNDLAVLENVLSHMVDDRSVIVADMVAGTDAFASTLHAQFDLTVLVVEPTWRGIQVYKDYAKLCTHAGCLHSLKVIGNKIKSQEDRALLEKHIPIEAILGYVGRSEYLERQDKTWSPIWIEEMEDGIVSVMASVYDALKRTPCDPQQRLQKMWDLHRAYVAQNFIVERFGDLTAQMDPDKNPPLPLVELPKHLNPLFGQKVRIYGKMMNFLPLANVKSLPALSMIQDKHKNGALSGIGQIVENSSGNTVYSLAVIGRLFGIQTTKAFVSNQVSQGKLQLLRFYGIEIMVNEEPICPDPRDETSGIYKAREMGRQRGTWNPGQYDNRANPSAHEKWTGPQIWEQTEGKISLFCAGLGTTGTMVGTGSYLKKKNPKILNLGVIREPNNPVPGVRTGSLLQEIAFDWKNAVNETVEVGTIKAFEKSLELCRSGILAGPSSGFALAGLLDFIAQAKKEDLDAFRNEDGEIVAVFICPDSPFPYIDEYFEYLDASCFPEIQNAHLLKCGMPEVKKAHIPKDVGLAPKDAFEKIYHLPIYEAWRLMDSDGQIPLDENAMVIDVRDEDDFNHAHLPQALHIDFNKAVLQADAYAQAWKGKTIFVICKKGSKSMIACRSLIDSGLKAYSIEGGMLEWSRQDLPRWRPPTCVAFQRGM